MAKLSSDQEELRQSIKKSATIWALVAAGIVGGIAYLVLGGQGEIVRMPAAWAIGAGAGYLANRQIFAAKAKSARCANCSATFSIRRSDRQETLVSSEEKHSHENQEDGSIKVKRWTDEKFDIVDTYQCSNCQDVSIKEYQVTRRKDEESFIEPAPVKSSSTGRGSRKTNKAKSRARPKRGPGKSG